MVREYNRYGEAIAFVGGRKPCKRAREGAQTNRVTTKHEQMPLKLKAEHAFDDEINKKKCNDAIADAFIADVKTVIADKLQLHGEERDDVDDEVVEYVMSQYIAFQDRLALVETCPQMDEMQAIGDDDMLQVLGMTEIKPVKREVVEDGPSQIVYFEHN